LPPVRRTAPLALITAAASGLAGALLGRTVTRRRIVAHDRARVAAPASEAPPEVTGTPVEILASILHERPPAQVDYPTPISSVLAARLTDEDRAAIDEAVETQIDEGLAASWRGDESDGHRNRLRLLICGAYGLDEALARTGLIRAEPPAEVHAMAHGPYAAAGDPYLADAMFGAMEAGGFTVPDGGTVLDFGCSSGRILRPIAAARPDLRCLGCDPNGPAIAWAQENLPMAEFFESPIRPPLALDAGSVDAAYALSIWSHFAREPALVWLEEMHRVIRPGGSLALTTHGLDTLASSLRSSEMATSSAAAAVYTMLKGDLHFIDVFGEAGDWGVVDPEWGNAFFTLDWLASQVTPRWTITRYQPGGLGAHQDIVTLRREP
jgi:SAM-dependent methyltransferase